MSTLPKTVKTICFYFAFFVAICLIFAFHSFVSGIIIGMSIYSGNEDFILTLSKECIEQKIEKGYPEDFANKYCKDISWGCRGRVYEENCNPEVKCCFVTIEEDKKWNYLDYDENGNKITK